MSALAAIYNLDGRPVSHEILRRMRDSSSERGPDAATEWVSLSNSLSAAEGGRVGLAHRMLFTTAESLEERQPWPDESGRIVLIYAGRVDNGEDLRREFVAHGLPPRNGSDAELLLRAYQRWGENFPAHVLGDFALVLWDESRQTLFCARDVAGIGQLHYFTDGNVFLCASEVSQLLRYFDSPPAPNEGMIAGYFAARIGNLEETIYQGIFRLAAGCSLSVSPSGVRKNRYWDYNPRHAVSYQTDGQYAEHFLELFREAVRCRTRSYKTVGLLLSGGLDSSAVGGVLHSLQREGQLLAPGIELYSMVFPGMDCDESPYIKICADSWGTPSHLLEPDADASTIASVTEEIARTQVLPEGPSPRGLRSIRRLVRERGVRVVLNGWGADELLTGSQFHHADLLAALRIPSMIRQLRAEHRLGRMTLGTFLRYGVGPLVPEEWRRARRRWNQRLGGFGPSLGGQDLPPSVAPPWIAPDFAKRAGLADRPLGPAIPPFPTHAQRSIYRDCRDHYGILDLETYEPRWADWQVQVRSPFLHRPLMEFCLAIPEEQRWRGAWTKYVLRKAMAPFVPGEILRRTDKPSGGRSVLPPLAEAGEEFFSSLHIAKAGWVCTEEVLRIYRKTAAGWGWKVEPRPDYTWPLWYILGTELWFRQRTNPQARLA
jgi:asparagine synthase (glutamine-hydrolysing)